MEKLLLCWVLKVLVVGWDCQCCWSDVIRTSSSSSSSSLLFSTSSSSVSLVVEHPLTQLLLLKTVKLPAPPAPLVPLARFVPLAPLETTKIKV